MDTRLLWLLVTVYAMSDCYAIKLDPLLPGNRRVDMHETACLDHEGPSHNMDIFSCDQFDCVDGTSVPVPQATPCKRIFSFGHCLKGQCLSSSEYLAETRDQDEESS